MQEAIIIQKPVLCKSMDWFLYDNDLRHERVMSKKFSNLCLLQRSGRREFGGYLFSQSFYRGTNIMIINFN